jgi:hypothetical protein
MNDPPDFYLLFGDDKESVSRIPVGVPIVCPEIPSAIIDTPDYGNNTSAPYVGRLTQTGNRPVRSSEIVIQARFFERRAIGEAFVQIGGAKTFFPGKYAGNRVVRGNGTIECENRHILRMRILPQNGKVGCADIFVTAVIMACFDHLRECKRIVDGNPANRPDRSRVWFLAARNKRNRNSKEKNAINRVHCWPPSAEWIRYGC